jgi:hypothetical protein
VDRHTRNGIAVGVIVGLGVLIFIVGIVIANQMS